MFKKCIALCVGLSIICIGIAVWAQEKSPKGGGPAVSGGVITRGPDGATVYEVKFDELITISDGLLKNALISAKGRYLHQSDKGYVEVTSEKVGKISANNLEIEVNGKEMVFNIDSATKLCKDGKQISWEKIKKGEIVTVTNEVGKTTAKSVRVGPMLLEMMRADGPGIDNLKYNDCRKKTRGRDKKEE